MKIQQQIDQKAYIPGKAGFISRYQALIKQTVIPYQYKVLWDKSADNSEKSHVIANFINAGKVLAGKGQGDGYYGMVFQDSDAAKWLEAVAYSLVIFPDAELEKTADELIGIIADAQDKNGYLNTYYTIKDQDKRWTNLLEGHELYCSGHMMEAACAYYEATGKKKILDVMTKNMEHIYSVFMDEKSPSFNGYPGHPEIELALMKLYRLTNNKHALELADHFISKRGVDPDYFEKEVKNRNWSVWGSDGKDPYYNQSDKPVRELENATGHAVRAVYLYTGMADLAGTTDDKELISACNRLWKSITQRQMYITGGIGSTVHGEAFSVDYDLPSDTAYCETCASIGLMFFASRMLELDVNREYSDIMEKAFYNTVLAGMQLDGKKFFYVNPLEVIPGIAGKAATHRHDLPQRPTWYACACCPPNVARLVSSFGKYAYGENQSTVFCHLFTEGEVDFANGTKLSCTTNYPYDFSVTYKILEGSTTLAVRIPGWSEKYTVSKDYELKNGYAYIKAEKGDEITVTFDSTPYFVYPSTKVPDLCGQVAVCHGPLVYCAESLDNDNDILGFRINTSKVPEIVKAKDAMNNDIISLKVDAKYIKNTDSLYSREKPVLFEKTLNMVPYYTWGNKGLNYMKIWFPYWSE